MTLDNDWYTEIATEAGIALSLRIKAKVHEEQTPYQRLEIYETEKFGYLMTLDGFVMLTSRDNFIYHEMMTHPALYTHAAPKRVLIIGGGDCGCLLEVLKHPDIEQADLVDIDERVTRASEKFFPELCASNDDPRASLNFEDGIKWVENAAGGRYDVIIIDSTDPIGQAARLYSEEFYRACHAALADGGVMVAQSESPLFHAELIKTMRERMQAAGFTQATTLYYPQCTYPSGWWSTSMACKRGSPTDFRDMDAEAKTFSTRYYNAALHRGALAAPEFMRAVLDQGR
jgi:spermidine synthase